MFNEMSCGSVFDNSPATTLKTPFILPSNLYKYKKLGIDTFKLATRGREIDVVKQRIQAYIFGNSNISISTLLDTHPSSIFDSVTSNLLEDYHFSEHTSNCKNNCHECNFCDEVINNIRKHYD